jgi:hypothetical protein
MVHAAWRDTRDAVGYDVAYYAKYLPGSRMMVQNVDLSSAHAEQAEYPVVAVDPQGQHIAVIFESSRGVQIARSSDGGQTFANEIVDATAIRAVSPHVVWARDGVPYAAWQSTRGDKFDVRVVRDQVTGVGEWGIGNGEWGIGNGEWRAFDVKGREVDVTTAMPMYQVRMRDDGRCEYRSIMPVR